MRVAVLALLAGCSFRFHGEQPGDASDAAQADVTRTSCLDGWCRRKPITVGTVTGGPHTDFPMLVHIASDPDISGATPEELRFTTAAGAPLSYERMMFSGDTGELVAWVRVPSLDTGTTIYLWWGKQGATDQQDRAGTWSASYAGVWHMEESTGTLADSTANANTAMPTNGPTLATPAVVGSGVGFDGYNDYLLVPQSASLQATTGSATFALWVNWTSLTSSHYQRILCSSNRFSESDGYEWSSQMGGDFYLYPWGGAEDDNLGNNPFTAGQWQYLVATLDFSTRSVKMYVDGTPMTFTQENALTQWTSLGNPGDWLWGSNIGLTGPFEGSMDEIQVMSGVRSPGWIQTAFANQKLPSAFYTLGPAETLQP